MLTFTMRTHRLNISSKLGLCSPSRPRSVPHCLLHTSPVQCQKSNPKQKTDPIADFFARFPDYNYNPNCTWPEEWRKLRQSLEEQLQRAAIERFQATYTSDLAAWHKMCRVLGIVPPPPTHQRCRRAIERIYVNLVDLEHAGHRGNGEVVQQFLTEVALSEYTKDSGKFYRRDLVPDGSLLKLLLRHIWDPRPEKVKASRNRKRTKSTQSSRKQPQ